MEDAVILMEDYGSPNFSNQYFFAVFDGHNGSKCSEFLASELPKILLRQKDFAANPCIAFVNAFQEADKVWLQNATKEKGKIYFEIIMWII